MGFCVLASAWLATRRRGYGRQSVGVCWPRCRAQRLDHDPGAECGRAAAAQRRRRSGVARLWETRSTSRDGDERVADSGHATATPPNGGRRWLRWRSHQPCSGRGTLGGRPSCWRVAAKMQPSGCGRCPVGVHSPRWVWPAARTDGGWPAAASTARSGCGRRAAPVCAPCQSILVTSGHHGPKRRNRVAAPQAAKSGSGRAHGPIRARLGRASRRFSR
jgi:hypothetical protein